MTAFDAPHVASRGTPDPDAPLVVLLHGRGSNENGIVALADHLTAGVAYAAVRAPSPRPAATPGSPTAASAGPWPNRLPPPWPGSAPGSMTSPPPGGPSCSSGSAAAPPSPAGSSSTTRTAHRRGRPVRDPSFGAGVPITPGRLAGLPVLVVHGDADVVPGRPLTEGFSVLREAAEGAPGSLEDLCDHVLARCVAGDEPAREDDASVLAVRILG